MRRLSEVLKRLQKKSQDLPQLAERRAVNPFPNFRKDFSNGVFGASGYDLANAQSQGLVSLGDSIRTVTREPQIPQDQWEKIFIYIQPAPGELGRSGHHLFLEYMEREGLRIPNIIVSGNIVRWSKTGRFTTQEELEIIQQSLKSYLKFR